MKILKNLLISFITLIFVNPIFAAAYEDDAADVDFYVPGVLANEAMETVNFLLCFMESIKFQTFVDKGVYVALTDEEKCESATGVDATSEAASATGSSASGGGAGGAANAIEAINYTSGTYSNVTEGNVITGKGWVNLSQEFGPADTEIPVTAYISTTLTADKSATNRFGSFVMRYDLRNDEANPGLGIPQAGLPLSQGYLNVDNSTIEFRESSQEGPNRTIIADLTDPNNQQGYMQSTLKIEVGSDSDMYGVRHQLYLNEGSALYCQKFESANIYTQDADGSWTQGAAVTEANLQTLITNAQNGGGYIDTDGGAAGTLPGEHCWDTSKSNAKRVVYEYGTYKNSDGERADLTTPALSLEANALDNPSLTSSIWSHASYWGVHVNQGDRAKVSASTIFRNQRNATDTDAYNLTKDYYEITKRQRQFAALNTLGGVSFQIYLGDMKKDPTWSAKVGNLNVPNGLSCNAAQGDCPEYSGTITVSGTTVTFNITHGMDWGNGTMPFALTTPFSFTAAQWSTQMTNGSGWTRRMHFWDPDSHTSYTIPYAAFGNVNSTEEASQVRYQIESKITIEDLATDISAGGAGATGLMCIRECLDATGINTAIAAAFSAVQAEASAGVLSVTPYKNVGPYWTQVVYHDVNTTNGNQDGGEDDILTGRYNNIGGIRVADAPIYTVADISGVKKIRDGASGTNYLEYNTDNTSKVDARNHGDTLQNYEYYMKPAAYSENHRRNFGWAFDMQAVINSDANKSALLCDLDGSGNARGYDARYLAKADNDQIHVSGATAYYCDYKMWEGSVATTYNIRLKQMPNYRLYNDTDNEFVDVSAPETVVFTVPATGVTYNFPGTDHSGKKFKLKFEGYGNVHNLPGQVVNTCTGAILGRYVNGGWNSCYRYIHDFIIPDGTVLTNASGGVDLKVRALRGDEYLQTKTDSEVAALSIAFTKTVSDLPATTTLQNLFSGTNSIGTVPATTLPSAGSTDPSVIHGEVIHTPPN